jgi:glyoxylate reductase/D-3-phosphoglycerate dehydrogenase
LTRDVSEKELAENLASADYFMGFPVGDWSPLIYEHLGNLRLVQLLSAGYDRLDMEQLRKHRVLVCGNGGANAISVAEHTVLLMLAVFRRITNLDSQLRSGSYSVGAIGEPRLFELHNKTVGLIGFGAIGREVARRVRAFGARVIYYDVRRAPANVEAELGASFEPFDRLLADAEIVSLHVPLTSDTREILDRTALDKLRQGAIVVNTSRGELIEEDALADAIRSGQLLGAGLDVFSAEPPPPDHPLLRVGHRVVATPHVAGPTWDSWERRFSNCFANIQRVRRGEPPLWIIPELQPLLGDRSANGADDAQTLEGGAIDGA